MAQSSMNVLLFRNNDNLSFVAQPVDITRYNIRRSLAAADLNQDGYMDIISGQCASGVDERAALDWYQNEAAQAFLPRDIVKDLTQLATSGNGTLANTLSSVDFDGDGDFDILASSRQSEKVELYENIGENNFLTHIVAEGLASITSAASSDIDKDGVQDIVVTYGNGVLWFKNLGQFRFEMKEIAIGESPAGKLIDINNDGSIDIIAALSGVINLYENNGNAEFTTKVLVSDLVDVHGLEVVDLDGDLDWDLVSTSRTDDSLIWFQNNAMSFTPFTISAELDGASFVRVTDIDADGDQDILAVSAFAGQLTLFVNDSNQQFTANTIYQFSRAVSDLKDFIVEDMDNDGHKDIVLADYGRNPTTGTFDRLLYLKNDGQLGFSEFLISQNVRRVSAVLPIDLDGDGSMELFSTSAADDKVFWFHKKAGQSFTQMKPIN